MNPAEMTTTPNVTEVIKNNRSGMRRHRPARPKAVTRAVPTMAAHEETMIHAPGKIGPPRVK
jgi:hypothetical protein